MIDDQTILALERLRDDLAEVKLDLRRRYPLSNRQVTSDNLKKHVAQLAEVWMVQLAPRDEIAAAIGSDYSADLNVHFQRLLTFSEHASRRSRYDVEINAVLRHFTANCIIPLKRLRYSGTAIEKSSVAQSRLADSDEFTPTAFLGQSFSEADKIVNECVQQTLESIGIRVITGEKPKADRISDKVKRAIESQYLFVGVFTRREKISGRKEWTTSAWVIDEKAYAFGKGRKLILLKEQGVGTIGGIQGDYEFLEFSRTALEKIPLRLLQLFELTVKGLSY